MLSEFFAEFSAFAGGEFAFHDVETVTDFEGFFLGGFGDEVGAEAAVVALAGYRRLGVPRGVEIKSGVAIATDDEAHGFPWKVDEGGVVFGGALFPVDGGAGGGSSGCRADVVGLFRSGLGDFVVGAD